MRKPIPLGTIIIELPKWVPTDVVMDYMDDQQLVNFARTQWQEFMPGVYAWNGHLTTEALSNLCSICVEVVVTQIEDSFFMTRRVRYPAVLVSGSYYHWKHRRRLPIKKKLRPQEFHRKFKSFL